MDLNRLKTFFEEQLENTKIELKKEEKEKLLLYSTLVLEYNKNINITGSKTETDFIKDHIIDSLTGLKYFKNSKNVIDIGSGSGLPGIPLAIVLTNTNFTLAESKTKKSDFISLTKEKLELNNIKVENKNAYEIKEKFDTITARAFSDIKTLVKLFGILKTTKAKLILYKAKKEKIEDEIKNTPLIKKYQTEIIDISYNNLERHLVIIK